MDLNSDKYRFNYLFLFSIFAPYITFGLFQSDTSPIYLFLLLFRVFLISNEARNGLNLAIFLSLILIILNITLNYDIRIIKFSATILISEALFRVGRLLINNVKVKFIYFSSLFWLASGLITLIYPNFFSFLFFRVGTSIGRGATGLTPEPSYYGISSALLYAIALVILKNKDFSKFKILKQTAYLFFVSCLISGSMHAILILSILALVFQRKLGFFIIFVLPIIFFLLNFQNDIRFFYLINNAIESGGKSLFKDASIAYRLTSFETVLNIFNSENVSEKESSGFGISILFLNQGFFGIFWLFSFLILKSWRSFYSLVKMSVLFFLLVVSFLIIGPLSNPILWIFIGVYSKNNIQKDKI